MKTMRFPTAALLAAMTAAAAPAAAGPEKPGLVVYSPHPVEFIDSIVREFETETGVTVEVVRAGTGELLSRIISERNAPRADVMWGGGRSSMMSFKARFEPYRSVNAPFLMAQYRDPDDFYTPFTIMPTVFMYNTNLVAAAEAPASWADLLDPRWRGKIAFADPAVSSSSFEALVTMLFAMGKGVPQDGWDYVGKFVAALGGRIQGSSAAVYGGVAEGAFEVGVTFEEPVANYRRRGAPAGIVYPSEGTVVEADGVAVIRGCAHPENARRFVDFVTGGKAQAKIAGELDRRPCRTDVPPAAGLLPLESMRVIPGDFVWAGENKAGLLAGFAALAAEYGAHAP